MTEMEIWTRSRRICCKYGGNIFRALLVPDSSINDDIMSIIDDGVNCPPPSLNEISTVIARVKNNKAAIDDGLPEEIFKTKAHLKEIDCPSQCGFTPGKFTTDQIVTHDLAKGIHVR